MEDNKQQFEDKMADLAAYLVEKYDMEPRDAAGLIMNSPQTQELSEGKDLSQPIDELAKKYLPQPSHPQRVIEPEIFNEVKAILVSGTRPKEK